MKTVVVGPFNRVEGDLEVSLDVDGGKVAAARVSSPLFRGFEQILSGKAPEDALVLVPRICGICSVAQSSAAAAALADAAGATPPPNGLLASNLALAAENIADHLTHFYLFFMPDLAREAYAGRPWHAALRERFRARTGAAVADVLAAREAFLRIMGVLAGKWPHTLALQAGGTTRAVTPAEKLQLRMILSGFRAFLERTVLGGPLEAVSALGSAEALRAFAAERPEGDLARFLAAADDLGLERLGASGGALMSYGAYALGGGAHLFRRGVLLPGTAVAAPLEPAEIVEDVSHAWMADDAPRHPFDGATRPVAEKTGAYTWCKAPRLGGRVAEVGALARQAVDGHPLARDLVARGAGVTARVVARLLELARVVPEMERWAAALEPGGPYFSAAPIPDDAEGAGLVEAARGSLGHWLTVRGGRIKGYQLVAPTTWNFSPRDAEDRPGALEAALVGVPAGEGDVAVQHVVRSFDPCMVCTVH
ncbi:MAG: nickel-dependent hydrogenase large subunit [Anaeromyxobacter sp.]